MISTINRLSGQLSRNLARARSPWTIVHRFLNLHEYQSKELMQKFGVVVQRGECAENPLDAKRIANDILRDDKQAELIVKAQIHAGGRGKGYFKKGLKGGVQICRTADEVERYAKQMIGDTLFTKQTGPEGQFVNKVLINHGIQILSETYFAIVLDRKHASPVAIGSYMGGMDIEQVAETNPGAMKMIPIDITTGFTKSQAIEMARFLRFPDNLIEEASQNLINLYRLFRNYDCVQVEINPLARSINPMTKLEQIVAVDAKFQFDDNAEFRQSDLFACRDVTNENPLEVKAQAVNLNYISLSGNIGCMVNGAGLAMATCDEISRLGGNPANFLDVGGGANAKQIEAAFELLHSDPAVKAILINIFGGIMRCDVISEGIVNATRKFATLTGLRVPIIVRLAGTNVELGMQILRDSKLPIITAKDLEEAAFKAIQAIAK